MAAALEPEFGALVARTFGDCEEKMKNWLVSAKVLTTEDFGLLAETEGEVKTVIMSAAKTAGVPTEDLSDLVAIKKLWKICRSEDINHTGLADSAEADTGLCDKTRKSCEASWQKLHNFNLPANHRLVSTQLRPMHDMSHTLPHEPKDFSLLPVKRMRLQDGSVTSGSSDNDAGPIHVIYIKLRAFFYSYAFVNIDQTDWFDISAAIAMSDRILLFLYMKHPNGRPPLRFFLEAWDATARVFQKGVRSGKSLTAVTEAEGTYQHLWSNYVPHKDDAQDEKSMEKKGGGGKPAGKSQDSKLAQIQSQKDQEIARLKRQLEQAKGTGPAPKSGKWSKKW